MSLKKIIELHFGRQNIEGADPYHQEQADEEDQFCALYVGNDVPLEEHFRASAALRRKFGADSDFAKEHGQCVRDFYVDGSTGKMVLKIGPMEIVEPDTPRPGGFVDARNLYRNMLLAKCKVYPLEGENPREAFGRAFEKAERLQRALMPAGLFFHASIAGPVIEELQRMGYEVKTYR